jgi:hypothetical protein
MTRKHQNFYPTKQKSINQDMSPAGAGSAIQVNEKRWKFYPKPKCDYTKG